MMFAAFKYCAVDYLYENMARQTFFIDRLSLYIPPCLHHEENYYHSGVFADDKYRRPWTRISVALMQEMMDISVLDQWKKSLYVEDFLEKKPVYDTKPYINNELLQVVPSSNPYSQTDIEEAYLLMKNDWKEDSTQINFLPLDRFLALKLQAEDLYVADELVFVDNLEKYCKQLPALHVLLSRLKIFLVKDPLLNPKEENFTEEDIFKESFMFQSDMETHEIEKELHTVKEHFCQISLKDAESLMLPVMLESNKSNNFREKAEIPPYLELKNLLNLTPEDIVNESTGKGWLEEKNSISNQGLLSAGAHHKDKTTNLHFSPQKKNQCSPLHMKAAQCGVIHDASTPAEKLTREEIEQNKIEIPTHFLNQEKEDKNNLESLSCQEVFFEPNSSSRNERNTPAELTRKCDDGSDLLSNFIMLRSKHVLIPNEEKNNVAGQKEVLENEEERSQILKQDIPAAYKAVLKKKPEQETQDRVSIQVQASEGQCQAYHVLAAAATPVLKEMMDLGMLASKSWRFAAVKFDHTRFFLRQQEKVICDDFKQGKTSEKELKLFKHAAQVHLLVTVRDLLLMCELDRALGYLSKAKDIYKSIFGSCLDNIWRQLEIIQFSRQKKHETNPKLIALHHHMLNWMQSNTEEHKVLIITRVDSDSEKTALIDILTSIEGLKTMDLNPEKRGALLECKSVINSLNKCSCAIVNYQHIGADFPWTHFSLVVEFDYTENSCWNKLCKNLNIPYITFKTTLPETVVMKNVSGNHFGSFLLETQIPYVFFTSEGLLNSPEILQLLESKYNITFVERCCSESLQLFGDTDRYVVLTIDEHTAIVLQNVEELSCEKSADNIILRLIALSLQYSCCWIILYSRERLSSEYSLTGKTLHHLALIYAGLISFAQKSEDFEVKLALAPGIEETALLIRQIADNILVSSQTNPHEWLDKSWLSVLPTEAEKHLLAFPCLNPLVSQLMLKRGSSLNRLLSATFDQLQELLPEVPEKVLKLFSDITSLYNLNVSTSTKTLVRIVSPQENWNSSNTFSPASFPKSLISSIQGDQKDQCSELPDNVQNTINQYKNGSGSPLKSSESQRILASSLPYYGWVSCPEETDGSENSQHYLPSLRNVATERAVSPSFLKQNNSNIFTSSVHMNHEARIPPLSHSQDVTDSNLSSYLQKEFHASNAAVGSKLDTSDSSVLPKNSEAFAHQDINNHFFHVQTQPLIIEVLRIF
ncbi:uncharacterized protein C9orf84 [Alligator sinensis]|uniref:Uncharacterized protein C9orf84 n=1 Tax=Alligator sinensis TaxID=38654 RepID=A0A3Q0GZ56_ALLSI|nr:uncharacterized protein C9orf84 [Alligator sinensis]